MLFKASYSSYFPYLIKYILESKGNVLELGTGVYSTPLLHWLCVPNQRYLYSYESDSKYFNLFNIKCYENEYHQVNLIDDWDKIDIEKQWAVAFIDHKPAERRKIDILKLANYAQYIVVHDTERRSEKHYHYKEIFPLFKYRKDYKIYRPHTTVLSNFIDVN